jgi:hypothetical protein
MNSPQIAAMQLNPSQQAVWTSMTQNWEPPGDSPISAEEFVMRPVLFRGSVPGVGFGIPGAGVGRYRDEVAPAFGQLPGASVPSRIDVAGRDAYLGTFSGGAALLTTSGCWGVMVIGRDTATVRAMAPELLNPATVPGLATAARSS